MIEELRRLSFSESRVPRLDALEVFVPAGKEDDAEYAECVRRPSRWFPLEGGHRVLMLHEGGDYDDRRFTFVKGGWDHEHGRPCERTIEPMIVCWVTATDGPFIVLCSDCYRQVQRRSLWRRVGQLLGRIFR